MEPVATIDERGRLLIPKEVRQRVGIKGRTRVLIRVRDDKVIEIIPLDELLKEVRSLFEERFRDWREEDHEATEFLKRLVK